MSGSVSCGWSFSIQGLRDGISEPTATVARTPSVTWPLGSHDCSFRSAGAGVSGLVDLESGGLGAEGVVV